MGKQLWIISLLAVASLSSATEAPIQGAAPATVFRNVRVFDGKSNQLTEVTNVVVVANKIQSISSSAAVPAGATVIDGGGRTLMPGLIDAHVHLMFDQIPQLALMGNDLGFSYAAATKSAKDMLMRGFTSARDVGGPVIGLSKAINAGLIPGPRIWAAGATISQTGGHSDFRFPAEFPIGSADVHWTERAGVTAMADNPDTVRQRAREQLALGASLIKVMAGGGVASLYDPLDVTQYTVAEIRAAVEAAENWGTYVTVHAYTDRATRQAIEAGVKCIDHGQLVTEDTVKLMAQRGVWWSLQPFLDDEDRNPYPDGSANRAKQIQVSKGTENAFLMAKKHGVKIAWGTDNLYSASGAALQGKKLAKLSQWFTPAEVLSIGTGKNGEFLALSGLRSPFQGKVGVIEAGAFADLLLVDGNPLENINLIADPNKNFLIIMKDGRVYKNTLGN